MATSWSESMPNEKIFTTIGDQVFGEVPGYPPGSVFENRELLAASGVHRPHMNGISGREAIGAESVVVVSGGYEDDEDHGDWILYTGMGGNDTSTKKQVADQELKRGNLALARSCDEGLPVRVIRGNRGDPVFSPDTGLRYDGLFRVEEYWEDKGKSGFIVWRFRLAELPNLIVDGEDENEDQEEGSHEPPGTDGESGDQKPPRVVATVQRIVRNTAIAQRVKALYEHRCQICGLFLTTQSGPYAEGAHIRALGAPHDGPDVESNVLCLCANCHVRFDHGGIYLTDSFVVMDRITGATLGTLTVDPHHHISVANVTYQRNLHGSES